MSDKQYARCMHCGAYPAEGEEPSDFVFGHHRVCPAREEVPFCEAVGNYVLTRQGEEPFDEPEA